MHNPETLLEAAAALAATASLPLNPPKPPPSVDGWFDPFKTVDMLATGCGEA